MDVQVHILYLGTVQGVGFRYTAQQLAMDFKLTGWVKNLKDGSVEILAQGSRPSIEKLQQNLEKHFEEFIKSKKVTTNESTSDFKDFKVIY